MATIKWKTYTRKLSIYRHNIQINYENITDNLTLTTTKIRTLDNALASVKTYYNKKPTANFVITLSHRYNKLTNLEFSEGTLLRGYLYIDNETFTYNSKVVDKVNKKTASKVFYICEKKGGPVQEYKIEYTNPTDTSSTTGKKNQYFVIKQLGNHYLEALASKYPTTSKAYNNLVTSSSSYETIAEIYSENSTSSQYQTQQDISDAIDTKILEFRDVFLNEILDKIKAANDKAKAEKKAKDAEEKEKKRRVEQIQEALKAFYKQQVGKEIDSDTVLAFNVTKYL